MLGHARLREQKGLNLNLEWLATINADETLTVALPSESLVMRELTGVFV